MEKCPFELPLRIEEGAIVEGDGDLFMTAIDLVDFSEDQVEWIVDKLNSPAVDDVLSTDEDRLISTMDRVQPRWWTDFGDPRDLKETLEALSRTDSVVGTTMDREWNRVIGSLKRRTLRRMKDVLWLVGHSYLEQE